MRFLRKIKTWAFAINFYYKSIIILLLENTVRMSCFGAITYVYFLVIENVLVVEKKTQISRCINVDALHNY